MRVREWDPAAAPDSDIENFRRLANQVFRCDLPDEPAWRVDGLRDYLAVNLPGERRVVWFAESADRVLGSASLLLVSGDAAVLTLFVHPAARRAGVGRLLLAAAAWRANAERRRSLMAEVMNDTAVKFYENYGFTRTLVEERHLLRFADVDWERTGELAGRLGNGYRVGYFPGGPPEDMLQSYAGAKLHLRQPPGDDGETDRMVAAEAQRLCASLRTLAGRGMRPHVVLAVHEATGQVAGLTEVVVPAHRPERADQYDTLVVQTHRGYGIGLAMKARMLLALRDAEPQTADLQTWQTVEMEQLARVNAVLGFVPDREWYEYEADVPELLARLSR